MSELPLGKPSGWALAKISTLELHRDEDAVMNAGTNIPVLHVESQPPGKSFDFELQRDCTYIGRSVDLGNILLDDERVSRRHAQVRRAGNSFLIEDFNSSNGTFVNGERVTQRVLADKDVIRIGKSTLSFFNAHVQPPIRYGHEIGQTVLRRRPDEFLASLSSMSGSPAGPTADSSHANADARAQAADDSIHRKAAALKHLYELSQMLNGVFSQADILKKVGEILFRLTPSDRFLALLKDPASGELLPSETQFRDENARLREEEIVISKTVLNRVMSESISLLSIDAQADSRLALTATLAIQKIHSIMCAPLSNKSGVFGVIYVDCQDPLKPFSADDLDLLNMLAVETSLAIDNATQHEQLLHEALARAAFGRFMPRHVVDELMVNPSAFSLGGSNQVVTTLFTDLRGFTSIAESLSPELVVQILNNYFSDLTPIIFENNGMLDKYIGDGLMALFGVPCQGETTAEDAVRAAIEMQRRMAKVNRDLAAAGLPEIAIGIGINTGSATVGYIGSQERTDYTAVGDAVNLAARLEKHAKAGQIVISESTFNAIEGRFPTRRLGQINVKGKHQPVHVFEVQWRVDGGSLSNPGSTSRVEQVQREDRL